MGILRGDQWLAESTRLHRTSCDYLFSLRNGLTAYAALSLETNSSCLHPAGLMAQSIRLDRIRHRQLDTSHGCRDHTVLPYASASFVLRAVSSLTGCPALQPPSAPTPRVHRIPPRVRDDRDTPLLSRRDGAEIATDLGREGSRYFCREDWMTQIILNLLGKLDFSRNGFSAAVPALATLLRSRMRSSLGD